MDTEGASVVSFPLPNKPNGVGVGMVLEAYNKVWFHLGSNDYFFIGFVDNDSKAWFTSRPANPEEGAQP